MESGEPFALAQADTPHEIFHAMDIPLISNQWWSAYISAKRLSGTYFRAMDELGYPPNRCRYCSLGLGCTLAANPEVAPWGGLPRPTVMVARLTCDCIQHVSPNGPGPGGGLLCARGTCLAGEAAGLVHCIRVRTGKASTSAGALICWSRKCGS